MPYVLLHSMVRIRVSTFIANRITYAFQVVLERRVWTSVNIRTFVTKVISLLPRTAPCFNVSGVDGSTLKTVQTIFSSTKQTAHASRQKIVPRVQQHQRRQSQVRSLVVHVQRTTWTRDMNLCKFWTGCLNLYIMIAHQEQRQRAQRSDQSSIIKTYGTDKKYVQVQS